MGSSFEALKDFRRNLGKRSKRGCLSAAGIAILFLSAGSSSQSLSLGLGNVLLRTRADTSPVVPLFGLNLPLIDMGDSKREIEQAEINRDSMQKSAEVLIRKLNYSTQQAASRLSSSLELMKDMQRILLEEQKKAEAVKQLVLLHRVDPLEQFRWEITAAETEIEYYRSVQAFREAAVELKKTLGEPVGE